MELPVIGDAALQERLAAALAAAPAVERKTIVGAWNDAVACGEQERFLDAVEGGRDALLRVDDAIQESAAGRVDLMVAFETINDMPDRRRVVRRLRRAIDLLEGPRRAVLMDEIPAGERAMMVEMVEEHGELIRELLDNSECPREILGNDELRDLGPETCTWIAAALECLVGIIDVPDLATLLDHPQGRESVALPKSTTGRNL